MLSVANSFRAVARRQSCRIQAARAVSSSSTVRANAPTTQVNSMAELQDYIVDAAEEQQTIAEGSSGQVTYTEGSVDSKAKRTLLQVPDPVLYLNSSPASSMGAKGFPVLKGFAPNKFVQPYSFTRDAYASMSSRSSFTKRPLLGPDASTSRYLDVFYQMDIDPLKECMNSKIMSRFVTTMGKIKGRNETNLTWKNQRKIGKAIRRSKMMGIIPLLSRRTLLSEANKR
ncbi:hypothetical protein OH77DRAFT_1406828 [Trametes cingulata]|nr:hypothetical protein OH77DRAFT_1406828 [Trametes cingulata]